MNHTHEKWYLDLNEYIKQGEPDKAERSTAWKTAIGLQDVDGLKTSAYLLETAKEHIEGNINITDAQKRIQAYYEARSNRQNTEADTKEADIVSSRITALLGEKTFQFSPAEWQTIHRRLFTGVFSHAGTFRTYNITKKEWVLNGKSVIYASYESLRDTMDYDFNTERSFSYVGLTLREAVRHISKFTSDIWQIHPFCEGNTRATAVFIIKYLKIFGFTITNDIFADNSWYFRNALVRANYNDFASRIEATTKYLELFFENLLMDAKHELRNRYLHVDYQERPVKSETPEFSKCKNCSLKCTLEELAILKVIYANPAVTQKELAGLIGKSERTIKTRTVDLQNKGYLRRANGKRNGRWEVLVDL